MATAAPSSGPGTVNLQYDGGTLALPLIKGSEGEVGIDIAQLRAKTGMITFDPGLGNTGACRSKVAFIDGEKGILRYRGYPIEELAKKSTFLEVAWLLIHGELPTKAELDTFAADVTRHTMLHENFNRFFDALPKDAHPMPVCAAAVGALATFYQQPETDQHVHDTITRLIAKMPTIAAASYKHSLGQPSIYPQNALDYASNFLHMMFATPCEHYHVDPTLARAVDLLFILHADHEQNCSTSTVRVVGSSKANLFASISAGISALWGPLHGGANQEVIEMLDRIEAEGGDVHKFVELAKSKKDHTRLMGFGHRVYKNFDPRATVLKESADEVLELMGIHNNPTLQVAKELERIALQDEYFISKKLYPNVDFYSGIILDAMGFPTSMFTPIFALARTVGWISQWKEMIGEKNQKIGRPRQLYIGEKKRDYVDVRHR